MIRWLLILPLTLFAIDYSPWFNQILNIETEVKAGLRGGGASAFYTDMSFRTTVWTDIKAEIEFDAAKTRTNGYFFEAARFNGLYRFMNDAIGDPLTVIAGATLSFPQSHAKRDLALFDPGSTEAEFHLIAGKEKGDRFWTDRYWARATVGIANKSSAWISGHAEYERNLCEWGSGLIFLNTLSGFGSRTLHPFEGYAHVNYKEAALGLEWRYDIYKIALSQTVYHRHYPSTTRLELSVILPLCL